MSNGFDEEILPLLVFHSSKHGKCVVDGEEIAELGQKMVSALADVATDGLDVARIARQNPDMAGAIVLAMLASAACYAFARFIESSRQSLQKIMDNSEVGQLDHAKIEEFHRRVADLVAGWFNEQSKRRTEAEA